MSLFRTAKPHLASIKNYVPGKPLEELAREYGVKNAIKMASNENALGPSPKAVAAIRKNLSRVHRYPEGGCHFLRQKLSKTLGVKPEELVFGNGSDELLIFAVRAFVGAGDEVVIADPTFLIYEIATSAEDGRVLKVPMQDFRYDLNAMFAKITPRTKLVFIANPDNPVGTYINQKRLSAFLELVPRGVLVVLDEAYCEFARIKKDYPDSLKLRKHFHNLIVTRTFSKAHGLAGLRVGYAVTDPDIAEALNKVREPFNVNLLAQAAAVAAIDDKKFLKRTVTVVNQGREMLTEALREMGFKVVDTVTNFILFDLGAEAKPVYEALLKKGVIVRPMGGWGLNTFLRVTIGKKADNIRFLNALKNAAAVLLFAFLLTGTAWADIIRHKNGQTIEGAILSENDKRVKIEVEGMEIEVGRADIASVKYSKLAPKRKVITAVAVPVAADASVPGGDKPVPGIQDPNDSGPDRGADLSKLEKPVLIFDDRKWLMHSQDTPPNQVIAIFYPEGQSFENWTERVTAQLFIGLKTQPHFFADYVKQKTASTCPQTDWKVLKEGPEDVLYQWSVKGCANIPDQSEIARVHLGVDGLHVLHYAIKFSEIPEPNGSTWAKCLASTEFIKP